MSFDEIHIHSTRQLEEVLRELTGYEVQDYQRLYLNQIVESTYRERPMPKYPEWFIGGPWHGEDKLNKAPNISDRIRVTVLRPIDVTEFLSPISTMPEPLHDEFTYVPRHAQVFGEMITVWVGESDASLLASRHDTDVTRLLGQLIMSPHRIDTERPGFDVGPQSQRHRQLFELERRSMREAEHRYGQEIRRLQEQLRVAQNRPTCNHGVSRHPMQQLRPEMKPTGILEFVDDDHVHDMVVLSNITLFFDEGNDEIDPSWIATAQGPPTDGDHGTPYTGYGTSKRGAIIALLADALDVYARMIETPERIR